MGVPFAVLLALLSLAACVAPTPIFPPYEGAVVALQDQSSIGFLDPDGALMGTLPLGSLQDDLVVPWMIHNVQIAPDGHHALATAMTPMDNLGTWTGVADELVIVGLTTLGIRRCQLDCGLGAAHVVTDGSLAWISAYDQDRIVEVDLASCETTGRWPLPPGTGPHGMRRSTDGASLYIAGMAGDTLTRMQIGSGDYTTWPLPGHAVQVAVLPDGSAVLATLQDTRQVARLDLATEQMEIFELPATAQGPAQIYPSPDSSRVWVADQGEPGAPVYGHELFALDARTGAVTADVTVDDGPHGVVVSADGATVWATSVGFGTVVRVDAASGEVLGATAVGDGPNGISLSDAAGVAP